MVEGTFKIGEITDLTELQATLLKTLVSWEYNKEEATAFNIMVYMKKELGSASMSNIYLNLRILSEERGLIFSKSGNWVIREKIKPKLIEVEQHGLSRSDE